MIAVSPLTMAGAAVAGTTLATAVGTFVGGLVEVLADPLADSLIGSHTAVYKLMRAVLGASVMIIIAWLVCVATGSGWTDIWGFVSPVVAPAAVKAAGVDDDPPAPTE